MKEPLSTDSLARLALLSSGLDETRMNPYISKISLLLSDSEKEITEEMNLDEKAEALLLFLHKKIFTRYILNQTYLHTVLDKGTYNCVSSAILYMIITRYHGIPVTGVHAEDHAFCFIPGTATGGTDVETTNEWGYDPGSRKEFQSSFTSRTGYAYVPPGNYRTRLTLGDRDMAGLILQNRIVELQKSNRHNEALILAADRLALTQSTQAREDFYNSVQNAAALKSQQRDYTGGIDLIAAAELNDADFPDFLRETRSKLIFNACAELVNKNNLDSARRILLSNKRHLSEADRNTMESLILQRDLEIRVKGTFSPELILEIAHAADKAVLSRIRAASLGAYHYSLESEILSRDGEFKKAYLFMLEAPAWIQQDREYKRLIKILRDNTAIEYHNNIVNLMQQEKYEEAEIILNEGLELIPRSSLLMSDKKKLKP